MIPFANQSIRSHSTPQAKPSLSPERSFIQPKIEPVKLSQPTGQLNTQHVSIKQIIEQATKKEATIDLSQMPQAPFDIDQLNMAWKQLAFQMKDEGQDTVYIAMSKRNPQLLNQYEVHLKVDNAVQMNLLDQVKSAMLEFLRKKLSNWSVQLYWDLVPENEQEKKLITGKDKFEELSKRNANLFSFLKTFNLDIDL